MVNLLDFFPLSTNVLSRETTVHSSSLSLMFMYVGSEKCLQVCERNLPLNVLYIVLRYVTFLWLIKLDLFAF